MTRICETCPTCGRAIRATKSAPRKVVKPPHTKLTEAEAREILALLHEGGRSQRAVAALYGVGKSCVALISQGKRYHIAGYPYHAFTQK